MKQDNTPMDPEVRMAALKLFQASDEFRRAYADWSAASGKDAASRRRTVSEAERSMDRARMELGEAQRRAQEHLMAPPKSFDLDL